jgi:hypothetical protein
VVDKVAIHDPGGLSDERPSFAVRAAGDAWEIVYVWETFQRIAPCGVGDAGEPTGIAGRIVTITLDRST